MKSLYNYLQECTTPANTMGMGDPSVNGDQLSEPLVTKKKRKTKH